MTIFKNILERMAQGQMNGLYAKPVLTLEHGEILFYEGADPDGTLLIDSGSQIPVCGTVHSLSPAVSVLENAFQGKTLIHYSVDKTALSYDKNLLTDGLLITCNGEETVIPLHVISNSSDTVLHSEKKEPERKKSDSGSSDNLYLKEKEHAAGLLKSYLFFLCALKKGAGDEEIAVYVRELGHHINELCEIRPECIRYRLFEAILAAKKTNLSYAGSLERRMRNIIVSAKKMHPTEFCLLRYLQYEIARAGKNYTEAASRKKQLIDNLQETLGYAVTETELICLLGEESLGIMDSDPAEFWEKLHELYENGCNSPFLYFYGICTLQSPSMEQQQDLFTDSFVLRCLYHGARYGLMDRESAERVFTAGASLKAPYLVRLYKNLYDSYPDNEMLLPLVRLMIRMDKRSEAVFPYYEQAVKEKLKPARLYDYYMYSLPESFDKPIERDVLFYFSQDSYVNPEIYLKLCVNVLHFYQDDAEIRALFEPHMEAFVRTQLQHKRYTPELAFLADTVLDGDRIPDDLKPGLVPLCFMAELSADIPDGCTAVYDSGIYKAHQKGTFKNGKTVIPMIGGLGTISLFDQTDYKMGGIALEITPVIQNEKLIETVMKSGEQSPVLTLLMHGKWLRQHYEKVSESWFSSCYEAGEPASIAVCTEYLDDPDLSDCLKADALRYLMDQISLDGTDELEDQTEFAGVIYSHMDLLEQEQAAGGFSYLVQNGHYDEAIKLWTRLDGKNLDDEAVLSLAKAMIHSCEEKQKPVLERILLTLLDDNVLEEPMLEYLAADGVRPMETQVRIFMTCREQKVKHQELSAQILLRQLMLSDPDWYVLQLAYDELVNHEQYEILNHAAMTAICYGYLFRGIRLEIDLAAFIQGEILFTGNPGKLNDLACLAFTKQMQHAPSPAPADGVVGVRRQICQELLKKNYVLDFVEREAVQLGLPGYPVITVDLSGYGIFKEDMTRMARMYPDKLRAEYKTDGQEKIYSCALEPVCESLYSARLTCFAGEHIRYRVLFGDDVSEWNDMEAWNYPIRNPEGLSERYRMLQEMSVDLVNGELRAESMQDYEVTMSIIHEYGNII